MADGHHRTEQVIVMLRFVACVVLFTSCGISTADEISGVRVPGRIDAEGSALVLNGAGLRSKTVFRVRVYVAALYLKEKCTDAARIIKSEEPRVIWLHFLRDISGSDLRDSIRVQFRKLPDFESLRPRVDELCGHLPSVRSGQRIRLVAVNESLRMFVDDRKVCTIAGKDLCDAVLAIYVGSNPVEPRLRDALLNQTRD